MKERTVELHAAFVWTCPECGADKFERGVTLEPEQVEELVPYDRQSEVAGSEGDWLMPPAAVQCSACGETFEVEGDQ